MSPIRRRTAALPGHEIAYVELPGTGVPVVLVHGVGSSIDTWGDIPQRLAAAGRAVVAVDLLGHGGSGVGNGDFSLGANASAIRDLLEHLGHERIHLVGHSLGGGVSLQLAYQFPHLLESLTLISSGGLGADVGISARSVRTARWVAATLAKHGVEPEALNPRALAKLEDMRDARRLAAFLSTVRSVVGPEGQRVSALAKMSGLDPSRVLIIWGDQDPMLPMQHGVDAHALLPGSRFVVVEGASHHPHTHAPQLVVDEILAHTVDRTIVAV
jgi:pimeloyl-ACP methyl ester carboxylesterase